MGVLRCANLLLRTASSNFGQGWVLTADDEPLSVNSDSTAVEIDASGQPKLFLVDGSGAFVLDDGGYPILSDQGEPYPTGLHLPCAFYRGDEALMNGVRRWQTASNGPQKSSSLLIQSGSYRHRYKVMHDAINALAVGVAYIYGDTTVIADNGGVQQPVDLDHGEAIARAAAMGSNVLSVVYDATSLQLRISWEKGTGPTWENATKHPFIHIDAKTLFGLY